VAVVAALPAVGALLVTSVFVVPAACARLLTDGVRSMLGCAVGIAVVQGALGLYLAYWLDTPPGPAVATLGAGLYALLALVRR
jgi:ABC-type Mn2+/Zn2+ transport system permease subunit